MDTISKHKTFIVNYGKGYFTDKEIREEAYWDDEIKSYRSDTGIWDIKLLYEIARGEVKDTKIEFIGD